MKTGLESSTNRRRFLRGAIGIGGGLVAVSAGCKAEAPPAPEKPEPTTAPLPPAAPAPLPDGLDEDNFHVHNRRPLALETLRSKFGRAPITPVALFFVRNNLPMPDVSIVEDADSWKLEVTGVGQPTTITLAQLKQMRFETMTTAFQCSGNGRKFFEHAPSGSQWATGAAGCAMWTGVRVRDVLEKFGGALADAKFLTSTGGEELPQGVDPLSVIVERSIPIEKGLEDCMLVWEMNGLPIPITHGGPLRLIVPGYFGCNQIKYVRRIACTTEETQAKIQKSGYRFRPIGGKGGPDQPSLWRQPVKSWINGPGADNEEVLAGTAQFYGVALSGERRITKVEYTTDGGKTWADAEITGPDLGPAAWTTFRFDADLAKGSYTFGSRATDSEGEVQPAPREENERGYRHNGWLDHSLTINVVDELTPKAKKPKTTQAGGPPRKAKDSVELSEDAKKGKQVVLNEVQPACGTCHTIGDAGVSGSIGPNLDELRPTTKQVEAAVENGVGAMPPYKSLLSEEKIEFIAKYVAEATR